MLAIFFHNARAGVKAEEGGVAGSLISSSLLSSSQPSSSSSASVKRERVKDEGAVGDVASSFASPSRVSYAGALAACELFASFASALCLPLPVVDRVLDLLMIAAAPAVGASPLPVKPPQSIDEEVFLAMIRAAYGTQHPAEMSN